MTIDMPRATPSTTDETTRRRHGARRSGRRLGVVTGASLALGFALVGCTAHANLTVSPEKFEGVVIEALSKVSDATPEVDCGSEQVDIVDGNVVHCDVNTAGYDVVYDSTATISTENGSDYTVDVAVDDQPKE